MRALADWFSTQSIVGVLCRERLAASSAMHDRQFFDRLVAPVAGVRPPAICSLMPPRSRWMRGRKKQRAQEPSPLPRLHATVMRLRREGRPVDLPWIRAQDLLIEAVQQKALRDAAPAFGSPRIVPRPKDDGSGNCRVLAVYQLVDKIVIGQAAAYLREPFEPLFLPCAYAFRSRHAGHSGPVPSHHDAVLALSEYWASMAGERGEAASHVVECDIQGFFDCVCHKTLLKSYDRLREALRVRGHEAEPRLRELFVAYLRSYSYSQFARPEALRVIGTLGKPWKVKDRASVVKQFHESPATAIYGIPQGGALSCFAANLLLHEADVAVAAALGQGDYYARYCDDMLVVSDSELRVEAARDVYVAALAAARLPVHPFKTVPYGRQFWSGKSKGPYRWRRPSDPMDVPWVGFVGYQLRFDGQLRIRPSSLHKELKKQADLTGEFLGRVGPAIGKGSARRSARRLLQTLRGRLEAMSVGRRGLYDYEPAVPAACWCAGFLALMNPHLPTDQWVVRTQLRSLDRGRGKQLARAKSRLLGRSRGTRSPVAASPLPKRRPRQFSGRPSSYYGQVDGLKKAHK